MTLKAEQKAEHTRKRRFGENFYAWKFVCPICGNVASVEDYRPFKEQGAIPESNACLMAVAPELKAALLEITCADGEDARAIAKDALRRTGLL